MSANGGFLTSLAALAPPAGAGARRKERPPGAFLAGEPRVWVCERGERSAALRPPLGRKACSGQRRRVSLRRSTRQGHALRGAAHALTKPAALHCGWTPGQHLLGRAPRRGRCSASPPLAPTRTIWERRPAGYRRGSNGLSRSGARRRVGFAACKPGQRRLCWLMQFRPPRIDVPFLKNTTQCNTTERLASSSCPMRRVAS